MLPPHRHDDVDGFHISSVLHLHLEVHGLSDLSFSNVTGSDAEAKGIICPSAESLLTKSVPLKARPEIATEKSISTVSISYPLGRIFVVMNLPPLSLGPKRFGRSFKSILKVFYVPLRVRGATDQRFLVVIGDSDEDLTNCIEWPTLTKFISKNAGGNVFSGEFSQCRKERRRRSTL